jgi:hypothetical protein
MHLARLVTLCLIPFSGAVPALLGKKALECTTDDQPTESYLTYMKERERLLGERGTSSLFPKRQSLNVDMYFHIIACSNSREDGWLTVSIFILGIGYFARL